MSTQASLSPASNPHGAEVRSDGQVRFRLWAPSCERIRLAIQGETEPREMDSLAGGWHEVVSAGGRYHFLLPNGLRVPDPASRYQPDDVHGLSEVVDPGQWKWTDTGWNGRPWCESVIYELHAGTFTPEGTFRGAIAKLDHLATTGITAIELMPIADFPGRRNWGYDGVLPYAADSSYGRPEDLKALVEAAHARGIMVFLDVVYNHFGPDGNYIGCYAPQFFTSRHRTPWGDAINFDGPESAPVREFFVQNALYWVRDLHIDGLRLDAVHAIVDDSPVHILREIAERVRDATPGRHVHLILENEHNEARWLDRRWYTAQWNDDAHHVLHTAVTGEDSGYYVEYCRDTDKLGRALAEGFAFQGEMMRYRGTPRGELSRHLPPSSFIAFLQNHDQIGNRAFGDRLVTMTSRDALRAAAAVYLLLPQVPMLFMGEEWGARSPFPFFCDFGPELAEAVRKGRREEFARFPEYQDPAARERIPDPQAEETFLSARLPWDEADAGWLDWYRRILQCRRDAIEPLIPTIQRAGSFEVLGPGAVLVRWDKLVLAANLSEAAVNGNVLDRARLIWLEGAAPFAPWSAAWWRTES